MERCPLLGHEQVWHDLKKWASNLINELAATALIYSTRGLTPCGLKL